MTWVKFIGIRRCRQQVDRDGGGRCCGCDKTHTEIVGIAIAALALWALGTDKDIGG